MRPPCAHDSIHHPHAWIAACLCVECLHGTKLPARSPPSTKSASHQVHHTKCITPSTKSASHQVHHTKYQECITPSTKSASHQVPGVHHTKCITPSTRSASHQVPGVHHTKYQECITPSTKSASHQVHHTKYQECITPSTKSASLLSFLYTPPGPADGCAWHNQTDPSTLNPTSPPASPPSPFHTHRTHKHSRTHMRMRTAVALPADRLSLAPSSAACCACLEGLSAQVVALCCAVRWCPAGEGEGWGRGRAEGRAKAGLRMSCLRRGQKRVSLLWRMSCFGACSVGRSG